MKCDPAWDAFKAGWRAHAKASNISTEDMWAPNVITPAFRRKEFARFLARRKPRKLRARS